MPFQDLRAAISKIPKSDRTIPGGGGKVFAPRGKGGDLSRMPFQNLCRFSAKPRRPKCDAPALTSTCDAPIGQKRQCIDAAAMPARYSPRLSGARIPQNHRMIETARDNMLPIRQGQHGAHRASMARQILRQCGRSKQQEHPEETPHHITTPPLTWMDCPVMYPAPGDERKAMAAATSSGVPRRRSGMRAVISSHCAAESAAWAPGSLRV